MWTKRISLHDPVTLGFLTFTAMLPIQAFHNAEHLMQMLQKYAWHLNRYPGLLGVWFDFEWIHLLYNLALFFTLLATWIIYRRNPGIWRNSILGAAMLAFLLFFQGFHVLEHAVRVTQYLQGMSSPTPGILGRLFPVLEYHFWLNSVVTVALILAYVGFRPWRGLRTSTAPDAQADDSGFASAASR